MKKKNNPISVTQQPSQAKDNNSKIKIAMQLKALEISVVLLQAFPEIDQEAQFSAQPLSTYCYWELGQRYNAGS